MLEWNHCWICAVTSTSTQQLRKTCTTHTQTKDWTIQFDWCFHSVFHCKVNQHRTNIPFSYTGCCIPKAQKGPLQNQVTAFQCYKITSKKSLSFPYGSHHQPPTVIDRHKTTRDHVFWRLHLLFNVLLSKDSSVHFFARIRIATFWTITACCYLPCPCS